MKRNNLNLTLLLILILLLVVVIIGCEQQVIIESGVKEESNGDKAQNVDEEFVRNSEFEAEKIVAIDEYGGSVFALTDSGKVFCWGDNHMDKLGLSQEKNALILSPTKMPIPEVIVRICAGYLYSMALTENGEIYTWGFNSSSNITVGDIAAKMKLTKVNCEEKFTEISVSGSHCLALTDSGEIYSWGLNHGGQLGDGTKKNREYLAKVSMPVKIKKVETGIAASYALGVNGKVYSWGYNHFGELGHGYIGSEVPLPTLVELPEKASQIAAGAGTAMVITESGNLYSWGKNKFGTLGIGNFENQGTPVLVEMPEKIVSIHTKLEHTIALTEQKNLYTWGKNHIGQLGLGNFKETISLVYWKLKVK